MPDDAPLHEGAVIDASALAAIVFGEPAGRAIAETISRQVWSVSTSLLEFEVRNVGLVKARRGELTFEDVERALRGAVFPPARLFDTNAAFALARDHGLTYYDAAYLQLAIEQDASLFTLDRQLLKADPSRCIDPSLV
jgi:predicted nucleic acid-binding protein